MKTFKEFLKESKQLKEDVVSDEKILNWLKQNDNEFNDNKYKINNGVVDSNGTVVFNKKGFAKLPFKFGKVKGDFLFQECRALKSLENFPNEVTKRVYLYYCTSLENIIGAPQKVGSFEIINNSKITSLDGCPKEVKKDLILYRMPNLKSLKGCPNEIEGDFNISFDKSIKSLKGCPKKVGGNFDCRNTSITSLEGISQDIKSLMTDLILTTYEQLKYLGNVKLIYNRTPSEEVIEKLPNLKNTKFKEL